MACRISDFSEPIPSLKYEHSMPSFCISLAIFDKYDCPMMLVFILIRLNVLLTILPGFGHHYRL